MKALRQTANEVKPEFWLMGEVIHGDYTRWVNEGTLHSVTNYQLHKALYSGHNDHNYFEIAHTVRRLYEMGGNRPDGLKLYNFVDNHDVERIYTKLQNKAQFFPVHVLLYTLPGIPSIYYGSEFGIEGKKERYSDDSLRPALQLADYKNAATENPCTRLITALGKIRQQTKALSLGDYKELLLTNRQYAFSRDLNGTSVVVTVNNDENPAQIHVAAGNGGAYVGALSGMKVPVEQGQINVTLQPNSGEIWIPEEGGAEEPERTPIEPVKFKAVKVEVAMPVTRPENVQTKELRPELSGQAAKVTAPEHKIEVPTNKAYEEMTIEELQQAILDKMAKNGPITDQMRRDVMENVYHNSLINWVKSFR